MKPEKKFLEIAGKIAAKWLSVDMDEDKRALEAWEQEDPQHMYLLDKLSDPEDFERNKELLSRFPTEEAWRRMVEVMERKKTKRIPFAKWMGYAALMALMVGISFYFYRMSLPLPVETLLVGRSVPAGKQGARLTLGNGKIVDIIPGKQFTMAEIDGTVIRKDSAGINYIQATETEDSVVTNQMETLTGMEYSLILADGTEVYLNAESRLKYPTAFRGKQRIVELSGEAFFKVAKDVVHPFIVKMQGVDLEVLGTSFNARSYQNEAEVVTTLVEGRVAVNGHRIIPGEQAVYSKQAGSLSVNRVEVGQYVAWRHGKFVFYNECLEDLMKTLARWYGIEYHFLDEWSKELRIGASFDRYENMDPIIDMLKRTGLVDVLQTDDRSVYISSKK